MKITSLNRQQQGIAHLMAIVVVVVVLVIGGAGYVVYGKQKDKKSSDGSGSASLSVTANKEVQDACNSTVKDKDFCKFASSWAGISGNYTTTITTTGEGASTIVMKTQDSTHTSITSTTDGKTSGFITIGNTSYMKNEGETTWLKFTSSAETDASEPVEDPKDTVKVSDFTGPEAAKTSYKKIGKEACGNLTCFKYQIVETDKTDLEQFIWFDTKDYLMRRYTSKDAKSTMDMSLTYGNVKVEVPSPVQDAPDYSSMSPDELNAALQAAGIEQTSEE